MRRGGGAWGDRHRAIIRGRGAASRVARAAPLRHNALAREPQAMKPLELAPGRLTLAELRALWSRPMTIAVDPAAKTAVDAAARTVDRLIASGKTVYGV